MKIAALIATLIFSVSAFASEDPRYCGSPKRDANGKIVRSSKAISEFRSWHPCPSTGSKTGACPGWAINHTIPIACGGCDAAFNMDWMPNDEKSCAGKHCRDRYERKIYAHDPPFPDTNNCKNAIVE